MTDASQFTARDMTAPATKAVAIVEGAVIDPTRALYIGTAGDLEVVMAGDGATVMFKAAAAGYHALRVTKVTANTLAADVLALY